LFIKVRHSFLIIQINFIVINYVDIVIIIGIIGYF